MKPNTSTKRLHLSGWLPCTFTIMRVAIIGAGCSGLTAIKNLVEAGVEEVVCYEKSDQVGGNWVFTAGVGAHSSVCETTHIISSRTLSAYLDFPMPENYPDYPSHRQVLSYFQSYTDHFKLRDYISFNTTVLHAEKTLVDSWKLAVQDDAGPRREEYFDFLLVANGHHSVPRMPVELTSFGGSLIHSHDYKSADPFVGKRVLVVGAGNSGCDCAVETSRVSTCTDISIRTPTYIVPKFIAGKPTDVFAARTAKLPRWLRRPLLQGLLKAVVGDLEGYGLARPKHDAIQAHPTLNSELLYRIRHGRVTPRRGISSVSGNTVHFEDGHRADYDAIIAATGYRIATPFFDADFLDYADADEVNLWLRMWHPDHPTLAFIGLTQPQGCIWPLSDAQARLAASVITGQRSLPNDIRARADRETARIRRQFIKSKRHALEVDYHSYLEEVLAEVA